VVNWAVLSNVLRVEAGHGREKAIWEFDREITAMRARIQKIGGGRVPVSSTSCESSGQKRILVVALVGLCSIAQSDTHRALLGKQWEKKREVGALSKFVK